jgi:type I restriction enzyme S subunit
MPRANMNEVMEFDIPFPKLEEQKRIVAMLDQAFPALDRASAYAEANLADAEELFENVLLATFDELVSSADMRTLAEAASDFSRGKSRHRPRNDPALYGGDYPFIQTGDIRRSRGSIREYSQTYNDVGLAQSKLWPVGTVCITIAANIAETGVLEFEGCFPDSVIGMVPRPGESTPYYVEYMLRYFAKELKLQGKGSAQDNINLATFEHAKFPFPSLERQTAVVEKLDSLAAEVAALRANYLSTVADLANLRQSLLHQAFSGNLT